MRDTTILFKDTSGQLISYNGVIKDITVRKQTDMEIFCMNRTLRMLSDVNQALIHISDEPTLLNEVCRIVVEEGEYRMVRVGFAENDEAKTLHPVAHAGFKEGCVELMDLNMADTDKGPSTTAIRTGFPYIMQNIDTDPNYFPWRAVAIQCGFKSIIALPLNSNDMTFGAIEVYSDGTNKFDKKEVDILKELSDDLAFGITTLRLKAKKDIAEKALKDSERKYRVVADNTYNWEFWTDTQGKFIYCSPSCLRVSGYTEAEFINDPDLKHKIVHPDYQATFHKHVHRNPADNMPVSMQFKIIHKDGTERWIEHVCQSVFDTNNKFLGFRGTNCDNTDKKETDRLILNAIISTEEKERNKFSQELHDGLGPTLSIIKLYFQWLSEKPDVEKQKSITEKGLQNIVEAIQTIREISNNLSPRILINLGLVSALKYLIQRINETQKLLIGLTFDEERRYNSQTEITLYRITSELLNNTIKYAKANTIQINISHNYDKNIVLLTYSDNGKGFNLNKVIEDKKGLGLNNIIQRVSTLKGFLNIDTEEGKPLIVRIELPLLSQ
ncbi:MAG: PAS domain-containing protein [Salinivirgaceae bacterium]